MEMVDMDFTRLWISGHKSRSVNMFSQRSDFWLLGLILDKSSLVQSSGGPHQNTSWEKVIFQCKLQFKCVWKLGGVGVGAFLFLPIRELPWASWQSFKFRKARQLKEILADPWTPRAHGTHGPHGAWALGTHEAPSTRVPAKRSSRYLRLKGHIIN